MRNGYMPTHNARTNRNLSVELCTIFFPLVVISFFSWKIKTNYFNGLFQIDECVFENGFENRNKCELARTRVNDTVNDKIHTQYNSWRERDHCC